MRNMWWKLALMGSVVGLSAACGTGGDDDDSATPTPASCAQIVDLNPAASEANFFYRANLWFEFNTPPESAVTITLTDNSGADVAGETTASTTGRTVTFDPTGDLASSASYTVSADWGCGSADNTFSTGPYGQMVDDASGILGQTYNLDLGSADFIEPPGVGPILQSQIGDLSILFMAMEAESDLDNDLLHILGALGDASGGSPVQQACTESLPFTLGADGAIGGAGEDADTPADWNDPEFQLGPTNLNINIQGVSATIEELLIAGTFKPDLSDIRGMTFDGVLDTRPLAPELDPNGDEGAICDLVTETVGVDCQACASDGEPFCLRLLAINIVAPAVDITLENWSCVNILEDADCSDDHASYSSDPKADPVVYDLCPDFVPVAR